MSNRDPESIILSEMLSRIELPEYAYEKAVNRYADLGAWLGREESTVETYDPRVFSQGSFRLGTAIRPISDDEQYDLDVTCKLRAGITKSSHSQLNLKELVGKELETYRKARGIESPLEPKHRCWRLEYKDVLSFHMDVVPCIPEDSEKQQLLEKSIRNSGEDSVMAERSSKTSVSITDDRHPQFSQLTDAWNISNPEGYALWFEARMNPGKLLNVLEKALVEEVPLYKRKSPLQQSIQLLKRHRDVMFADDENSKPISIIITTLAARAYNGESDIPSALRKILEAMGSYVRSTVPKVPNPVDPGEDFADRWSMSECAKFALEANFWKWLNQAKVDFDLILKSLDPQFICQKSGQDLFITLNEDNLRKGLGTATKSNPEPKIQVIERDKVAKPWSTFS